MTSPLFYLDAESTLSLHTQIRAMLIDAVVAGKLPLDQRLPSTRVLAKQLGVSRNTVIAVTQELVSEGYLISRERSGCYVNPEVLTQKFDRALEAETVPGSRDVSRIWRQRLSLNMTTARVHPQNWRQYPYPFIEGQFDESLFPIAEWRECNRIAQGIREINSWAGDSGDADDASLIEQIRSKILPQRGMTANPDEILITVGSQHGLSLCAQLLMRRFTRVAMEYPGYQDAIQLFSLHTDQIVNIPVDAEGLVVSDEIATADIVYTTPSHQFPTTVTMSLSRRKMLLESAEVNDFVILEDDSTSESNFVGNINPALKSLDSQGRVIYLGSLSRMFAPGVRIGFLVGPREFIRQARLLRRLTLRHPAGNNQRVAALFLTLGHYDTLTRRLNQVHKQRWLELRQAVNYAFPQPHFMITRATGGTACWIRGPDGLDVFELAKAAARQGILLDSPETYLTAGFPRNYFRLSVTSISAENIRPGLEKLARLINQMLTGFRETLETAAGRKLDEAAIRDVMPGSALIGQTAYGDHYTATIHENGKIDIRYDNENQDTDTGKWWVESGQWWRQFKHSTYGEARGFHVVLEGNSIKWFDSEGDLVDTEVFIQDYQDRNLGSE